jgi:hypothetical protein
MRDHALFDKIDLHLINFLHTVLTAGRVSHAAVCSGIHQSAVSGSLKRLPDFAHDPLLVRVRVAHFSLLSAMEASSLLVLTMARAYSHNKRPRVQ